MTRGSPLRDRMLGEAGDLFYAEGITATGVDRVAEVVGVSKRTLYKHFGSKEQLVAQCLRTRDAPLREVFTGGAAPDADPVASLHAVFTVLGRWLAHPDFRGCPYLNAVAELPDPAHPAREVAVAHKQALRAWMRERARAAGAADADELAAQLMTLFDGAIAQRAVLGPAFDPGPVQRAAAALVTASTSATPRP